MKRNCIALAVFAAASGASAQSSVTVFGVIDASVSHYSVKSKFYTRTPFTSSPQLAPSDIERSLTVLGSSNNLPSRIGFRGTEDLGGGLSAGFWLESSMTNDDGATGIASFARRSTVSLNGPFGEVRLGRDFTTTYWADTLYDPLNNIGVGANLTGVINGRLASLASAGGPDGYPRLSNSISYFLPRDSSGVYGQVQYGLHEGTRTTGVLGSPSERGRVVGVRLGYASGPLDVSGGYTESIMADTVSLSGLRTKRQIKIGNIGAVYDLGPFKLHGELAYARDVASTRALLPTLNFFPSKTSDKYTGVMFGLSIPIGAGSIRASYSRVKFKDDPGHELPALFAPKLDAAADKVALGYVHNLSKRTLLYATVAHIRIKNGQNNPVMAASTANALPYFATGTTSGFAPRSAKGYDAGIRHSF